ncbi:hypothetical protein BX616_000338 [Lobosporangium transversale]|uniref:F-box domain-containing protein n=1 Tax=Lobosporangium transversale TaxID=64571 RepID=A0A1Y2GGT7_9FUNG|nr:hypothetical protein BCR41DRAFT_424350 [Lobosporangium transversale]KAF9907780.1 hypothetical protein BX616_000338 [Lobosporangium transversale]ORZ08768.1 hypothetical protein BCR41DRAFT_424350 [Lobosporangium transversale]|eukprot:XP_021878551.1 hypothetical protein BCR41DRAFT_424350 [Lobosporangium transversale]
MPPLPPPQAPAPKLPHSRQVVARLAPEITLHILSFLPYHDHPSVLWPILTLCKSWARLALELLYEQPVLSRSSIDAFITTLSLQDRLNGETIFWDTQPPVPHARHNLGIDYRSLIKKPCRIIGPDDFVKEDLIQLWDLQALLWTAPAFSRIGFSSSSSASALLSPTGPKTSILPLSNITASTTPSESLNITTSTHPPTSTKPVLQRRKKRSLPPPGPVVMLLDVSRVISDPIHEILREVPGMKLQRLYYKWLLKVPLLELLEMNLPYLQELTFSRPPTRHNEFMAVAEILGRAKQLRSLTLDHCQAAGNTVLTQLARSCGSSLRTLEIRQPITIRPMGNHSLFPVDGPADWDNGSNQNYSNNNAGNNYDNAEMEGSCHICSQCFSLSTVDTAEGSAESNVSELSVPEAPVITPSATVALGSNISVQVDVESRTDLALKELSHHCAHLARLRLQHLTWLSDDSLADFQPCWDGSEKREGLVEIELLDSYYGSQVTVEGLLDLCGPRLKVFVVDRKSCWRTRTNLKAEKHPSSRLSRACSRCQEIGQSMVISTGDRLVSGLMHRENNTKRIRWLETLVLIEHWVSLPILKAALECWFLTLRVLNVRLFKCSMENLSNALNPVTSEICSSALENITLGLPWVDVGSDDVSELVRRTFATHMSLSCLEINKHIWQRKDVGVSEGPASSS